MNSKGRKSHKFLRKSQNPNSFIHSTGNTAINKPEKKKKSLHSENLHSSGHNVKHYDLGHKNLFIGMLRWEELKFHRG